MSLIRPAYRFRIWTGFSGEPAERHVVVKAGTETQALSLLASAGISMFPFTFRKRFQRTRGNPIATRVAGAVWGPGVWASATPYTDQGPESYQRLV